MPKLIIKKSAVTEAMKAGRFVKVTGNTYPVKEQLKLLGGRWNAAEKVWEVPDARFDEALELVANAIPEPTPTQCKVCGDKAAPATDGFPEVKIYRSGECQSCFEERKIREGKSTGKPTEYTACKMCGIKASRYVKIYGSGECRDCYEERKMGY